MGNCFRKQRKKIPKSKPKSTAEIAPSEYIRRSGSPPEVTLYGNPTNELSYYLRFALLFKPVSFHYVPTETLLFTVQIGDDDIVSGSAETVLHHVESKFPEPPLFVKQWEEAGSNITLSNLSNQNRLHDKPRNEEVSLVLVRMARLQHKSMTWHLERLAKWGLDLATRGGKAAVDPGVGTPRMEVRKFGKRYGMVLEVLVEHAQMEERVIFPILQSADQGLCRSANEEHARDLPIMNGIKEDIKSICVLDPGTPAHREALYKVSDRLETLQGNCIEHFEEEEKSLFPLLQATELTKEQQRMVVRQCTDVMEGTHSHLFRFFMEGLRPHEAMQYLNLVMNSLDKEQVASMLRTLVD